MTASISKAGFVLIHPMYYLKSAVLGDSAYDILRSRALAILLRIDQT